MRKTERDVTADSSDRASGAAGSTHTPPLRHCAVQAPHHRCGIAPCSKRSSPRDTVRWRSTASSAWAMRRLSLERSRVRVWRAPSSVCLYSVVLNVGASVGRVCGPEAPVAGVLPSGSVAVGQCCRLLYHGMSATRTHTVLGESAARKRL